MEPYCRSYKQHKYTVACSIYIYVYTKLHLNNSMFLFKK
jgi:hypothetical protein